MNPSNDLLVEMHRRMVRIRRFEEAAADRWKRGEISGVVHTSVGQEASAVGACTALRDDDYMTGTHRSHGHPIGKGAEVDPLFAELLGKATGINAGKGGSMHLSDFGVGSLGETSIVGSGIPVATGAALGSKMQGNDRVALCFFGDGASSQGTFHESLNLAALWKLPVIYLCENNQYGEWTSARDAVAVPDIAVRAAGYDMPGVIVDGQDVVAVWEVVTEAVARARAGEGPSLIEAKTYRFDNHAVGQTYEDYRSADEVAAWKDRDPIVIHRARLLDSGVLDQPALDALEEEEAARIAAASAFADDSPYPEACTAFEGVYANPLIPVRIPDLEVAR